MGLAASQARYLALTSRKSDLEYQSQTINTRRLQLAYKTAQIASDYSEGMANSTICISSTEKDGSIKWDKLDWMNLKQAEYMIIGMGGAPIGDRNNNTSPYIVDVATMKKTVTITDDDNNESTKSVAVKYVKASALPIESYIDANGKSITPDEYDKLTTAQKEKYTAIKQHTGDYVVSNPADSENVIDGADYLELSDKAGYLEVTYDADSFAKLTDEEKAQCQVSYKTNPEYPNEGAYHLQTMLESGRAQIVTKAFFDYLVAEYGYTYQDGISPNQYAAAIDEWENANKQATVDWRSDDTSTFKSRPDTSDDEKVLAKYEQETAAVQAQDKALEVQEKNIETQHKAIETEMEAVKKVIQKNIEETFKIFG